VRRRAKKKKSEALKVQGKKHAPSSQLRTKSARVGQKASARKKEKKGLLQWRKRAVKKLRRKRASRGKRKASAKRKKKTWAGRILSPTLQREGPKKEPAWAKKKGGDVQPGRKASYGSEGRKKLLIAQGGGEWGKGGEGKRAKKKASRQRLKLVQTQQRER